MLRVILSVLFLGIGFPCFSDEVSCTEKECCFHNESLPLVYIGFGNWNLLSHNYSSALDDFQRASSLLDEEGNRWPELDFLISFGKVIAYDNLGLKDECQSALISLFLVMSESEDEDDGFESDEWEDCFPEEYYKAGSEIMKSLAALPPSPHVRDFLLHIVDVMSEE